MKKKKMTRSGCAKEEKVAQETVLEEDLTKNPVQEDLSADKWHHEIQSQVRDQGRNLFQIRHRTQGRNLFQIRHLNQLRNLFQIRR